MTRHLKKGLEVKRKSSRWVLVKPKLISTLRRSIRIELSLSPAGAKQKRDNPKKDGFLFCKRSGHKGLQAWAAAGERQGHCKATEVRGAHFVNVAEVRKLRIRVLDTGGSLEVSWERGSGKGRPSLRAPSEESLDSGSSPDVQEVRGRSRSLRRRSGPGGISRWRINRAHCCSWFYLGGCQKVSNSGKTYNR